MITKLAMPKWGLSMRQGKVVDWLVEVGEEVAAGEELFEVETEKIDGAVEAPAAGVLRRRVAEVGAVVPVGGLVGVLADPSVPDAEVDAFVAAFQASFVPEEAGGEAQEATRTVEVAGRRLRYLEQAPPEPAGDPVVLLERAPGTPGRHPVVLLHGFGGDLNNWLFTTGRLAERRRVVALDLPGHGGSAKEVGAGDLAELAGALGGFLDAVGVGRAHLVGHSLGGAVALAFALDQPDRAASLTLVAPAALGGEINAAYVEGFVAAERRRELKGVLELLFADPGLVNRQLVDDVLRYKRLDGVDQALRTVAGAWFPGGRQAVALGGRLERLTVPLLAIWGGQDRILPAAHAARLRAHGRVEVIAGAGHSPHMEAANEVNRLVGGFLDELEGEPS